MRPLPALNLACSGLAIGMGRAEFVKLAERIAEADGFAGGASDMLGRERNPLEEQALARRRGGLERLYDLFAQAPVLGSLIDPRRALGDFGDILSESFEGLSGVIGKVLGKAVGDPDIREAAVTAQGLAKAAELLGKKFALVATNVPFQGSGEMDPIICQQLDQLFPASKDNVAAAFIERYAVNHCGTGATMACVTTENWLFLVTFRNFRKLLLQNVSWRSVARIGEKGFVSAQAAGAFTALVVQDPGRSGSILEIAGFDVSGYQQPAEKSDALKHTEAMLTLQSDISSNPDHMFSFRKIDTSSMFSNYGGCFQGISPGDGDRVVKFFPEFDRKLERYDWMQSPPDGNCEYAGRTLVVDEVALRSGEVACAIRGRDAWGKRGVAIGQMRSLPGTIYTGELFSNSTPVIIPKDVDDLPAIWCFHESGELEKQLREVNPKVSVDNGYVTKIPFDLARWRRFAAEHYPNGLPKPYSNDPTQWLFDGHPRGSADPNTVDAEGQPTRPGMAEHPLQVAVARLLGYRWPRQTGSSFMDCPAIDVPDEIEASARVDVDGIVCLPALAGEAGAAERLRGVLQSAWGSEWREGVVRSCLQAEEAKAEDLDAWLADEFFDGHCRLFHQTPFVWHVWDGLRGGFSALVNYHQLCALNGGGRRLLEKLRDTYLGEWIARQRRLAADGDAPAEDRLAAAEHLRVELTRIIEGEPPYDIFVRWKPLHEQPIGWEPDIDDGVRLNIRPFITARPRNARGTKACILRVRPSVKKYEGADRGGEPYREKADYPWFWAEDHDVATEDFAGDRAFKGRRYNDFHYTRRVKQAARTAKAPGSEVAE